MLCRLHMNYLRTQLLLPDLLNGESSLLTSEALRLKSCSQDRSADFLNPSYQALPGFLASTNYESPSDPTNTAVQTAFDAKGKDLIGILMSKPESAMGFGTLMSTWGEGNSLIQDLVPVKEKLQNGFDDSGEKVMWVDVGGGYGQKTIALKAALPELPGRFIVQDLPGTIENAPKNEGIGECWARFLY